MILTNGTSDFKVQMNGRVQADDVEAMKALAELEEGIAWLPDFLTEDAVEAGKLAGLVAMAGEAAVVAGLLLRLRWSPVRAFESGGIYPNGTELV